MTLCLCIFYPYDSVAPGAQWSSSPQDTSLSTRGPSQSPGPQLQSSRHQLPATCLPEGLILRPQGYEAKAPLGRSPKTTLRCVKREWLPPGSLGPSLAPSLIGLTLHPLPPGHREHPLQLHLLQPKNPGPPGVEVSTYTCAQLPGPKNPFSGQIPYSQVWVGTLGHLQVARGLLSAGAKRLGARAPALEEILSPSCPCWSRNSEASSVPLGQSRELFAP